MPRLPYFVRVLHGKIHEWQHNMLPLYIERLLNPHAVYLVMTPEHGNLGDHAIALSETEILCELKIPYIEITGKRLDELSKKNCLHIMNGRPILINGGGNLGMLWPSIEMQMRKIVLDNPKSKILILPNTIYYDDSEKNQKELRRSQEVYNSHRWLKMYAREKISYDMMRNIYNDVKLVPDMVLRLNKCKTGIERKGCILCLRSDREKTISKEQETLLKNNLMQMFGVLEESDMHKMRPIPLEHRANELDKQFDAFRHAELVVTDRLHGMIFSAITGTPCIVIDSKSPKVRGCYEWIKDLDYIKFCENASEIQKVYDSIKKQEYTYNCDKLMPLYDILKKDILLAVGRK